MTAIGRYAAPLWMTFAVIFRLLSIPGYLSPYLAIPALTFRILHREAKGSLKYEYAGGFVFWLISMHFLGEVNAVVPPAAASVLGLIWPAESLLYDRLRKKLSPFFSTIFAFTSMEYLRMHFLMGGIPWNSWGLGMAQTHVLSFGSIAGEGGAIFAVILLGASLHSICMKSFVPVVFPVIFFAVLLMPYRGNPPANEKILYTAVQPAIGMNPAEGKIPFREQMMREAQLIGSAIKPGGSHTGKQVFSALVLPESMWPSVVVPGERDGLVRWIRSNGKPETWKASLFWKMQEDARNNLFPGGMRQNVLISGAQFMTAIQTGKENDESLSRRINGAVVFDAEGRIASYTNKKQLVPLGETLFLDPVPEWIFPLADLLHGITGYSPTFSTLPDDRPAILKSGSMPAVGVAICWENFFEEHFRHVLEDGDVAVFVILSNEAGLGMDKEIQSILDATSWRAAESGRSVLRVSNSGPSGNTNASGKWIHSIPLGRAATLTAEVLTSPGDYRTFYCMAGWLLLPSITWITIILLLVFSDVMRSLGIFHNKLERTMEALNDKGTGERT